jgi:HNH endonuclease
MLGRPRFVPLEQRFWSYVRKTDGCWLWTGSRDKKGYGRIHVGAKGIDRRPVLAHRLSWALHFGEAPSNVGVLHRCDNPPCVRPDHLFLGGQGSNMQDCAEKDRIAHGERVAGARLRVADVEDILRICGPGRTESYRSIGARHGVSEATIRDIASGRTWRRVREGKSAA